MENALFDRKDHMERLKEFNNIIEKIKRERNILRYDLFNEIKVNSFYMDKFLSGANPNFPNQKVLERLAEVSNGVTTYEELLRISGYVQTNYRKQVNPIKEIFRGDIFFADLGKGIGSEQLGERPVLVIQNDLGNKYAPTIIVAPITSQIKQTKLPTHILLGQSSGLECTSVVLFEQIRTIDKARLKRYIGRITGEETLKKADKAYKIAGGTWNFIDDLMEKLDSINENSKTQLGVFKKLFNVLFNKYLNKELTFNRTA